LAGITWIGLLYYFNFVQVPSFAQMDAGARNEAIDKLASRALWWFRYGMLATVITGLVIMGVTKDYFDSDIRGSAPIISILTGALYGLTMAYNVWMVIWKNQKIVLANAAGVLAGKPADPGAAAAGRKAFMASRQNVVFSVAMVWFMTFTTHLSGGYDTTDNVAVYWIITLVIWAVLEANALGFMPWKFEAKKGLNQMYESVQNVLIAGFVLWAVMWLWWEIIFGSI
jgi:uncharacterized membrane protein